MDPPDVLKLVYDEDTVIEKENIQSNHHKKKLENSIEYHHNDIGIGFKDQSAIMWTNLTYFLCIILALVFIFKYFSK
jgi:hypothetical protein